MPPQDMGVQDVGGRYSLPLALGTSSNLPVRSVEGAEGAARAGAPACHAHISSGSAREASMRAVAALAAERGFDAANASALHVLVDAMGSFMRQVAVMAQESYAEASLRPHPVLHDGLAALWDVGGPLTPPQLKLYAQKRGANPVHSDQSLRGSSAPPHTRRPAPVPLQVSNPSRPTWADPSLGFLTAEGNLEPEPPVQPDREDVPIPGRVGAFKSAVLPYPPLPPGYTYRAPEDDGEATSFTGEGPSSALVAVEKAWTKSQLTQASLKSLIRRIDAATQGAPPGEEGAASAPEAPTPLAASLAPAASSASTSLQPTSARTPVSASSAFAPPPSPLPPIAPAPASLVHTEPEGETSLDPNSSPLPLVQAGEEPHRKRVRLGPSTADVAEVEGFRIRSDAGPGHGGVGVTPHALAPNRRELSITVPEDSLPLTAPVSAPVLALKSPFAFPPPSPVSRTFIRAWQEAHPPTPTTPAAAPPTAGPDLEAFTPASLPGVVNFKSTWFAPRVRPRS